MISDGLDSALLNRYFGHADFALLPELLKINIVQPSGKAGYERFVQEESVNLASKFLSDNRGIIESALQGTDVDPEVVTAILMVESNLGKNRGTYPIFNVYSSLTLLGHEQLEIAAPDFWEKSLENIPESERDENRKVVLKKAQRKANWAYKQLTALIEMSGDSKWNLDPIQVKGSWAGAYGIPQFIPTSVQAYGKDGDGDGIVDLMTLHDAAASVGNYLAKHKYRSDNPAKRKKAVWHYNHSDEYVDCILTLRDKVKDKQNDSAKSE